MNKRLEKYKKKYNADTVGKAYDATKDRAVANQRASFPQQVEIELKVKEICTGIPTTLLPYYIIFGKELYKLKQKHTAETLEKEICIKLRKWRMRGLNYLYLHLITDQLTGFACFEKGMILLWHGAIADIPDGWHLCDGTHDTPDLRDNFIPGAGTAYNPDDTGGNINHTHTFTSVGHMHTFVAGVGVPFGATFLNRFSTEIASGTTNNPNNPLPYYSLAYIMKL